MKVEEIAVNIQVNIDSDKQNIAIEKFNKGLRRLFEDFNKELIDAINLVVGDDDAQKTTTN